MDSIKKADLDSFLSASSRADFSYRLLIGTTKHPWAERAEYFRDPAHAHLSSHFVTILTSTGEPAWVAAHITAASFS